MTHDSTAHKLSWNLGIALISAAVLHLQMLEVRVLSFVMWHHLTYLVITVTMLGFALASTLLACLALDARVQRRVALCAALGFAVSLPAAFALLANHPNDAVRRLDSHAEYLLSLLHYAYLAVPSFLAGLAITAAIDSRVTGIGTAYASSLIGSALGAPLFLATLKPFGAEASVFLVASTAAIAAAFLAHASAGPLVRACSWMLTILFAVIGLHLPGTASIRSLLDLDPAPSKALAQLSLPVERTVWDPLCRIDVAEVPGFDRFIFQDGDAPAALPRAHPAEEPATAIYSIAYRLKHNPQVLVIGAGGGLDLWTALRHGAQDVTGVEINPSTAEWMLGPYRDFSGSIYSRSASEGLGSAHVVVSEGRHFVRRDRAQYDVLQMTGTDTYTALTSGAYVLAESYLYTREAFEDYFESLKPDGILSILRFGFRPPRESLRACATASAALRARGVENPERHCVVVHLARSVRIDGRARDVDFAAMLFKNSPFVDAELDTLRDFVRATPRLSLAYAPDEPNDPVFRDYFAAVAQGAEAEQAFLRAYPYRVVAATDDKPFFFHFHRWSSILDPVTHPDWFGQLGEDPVGLLVLGAALLYALVGALLCVLLPFWIRRPVNRIQGAGAATTCFLCIGFGYLAVEIVTVQRFVLYLGHPVRSFAVVVSTLLLSSGAGASCARKLRPLATPVFAAIVTLLLLQAFALPLLLEKTLGESDAVRFACAVLSIAPLAFLMGVPFPTELAHLRANAPHRVAWAIGVNGAASVLASVLAVCVAIEAGFQAVLFLAALAYLGAAVTRSGGGVAAPEEILET